MIVEIGHFYTNEKFNPESLRYLYEQKFDERDTLVLFIDDYTFPHSRELDVVKLKLACEEIVGTFVEIHYESQMSNLILYNAAVYQLDFSKIEQVSINGTLVETRYKGRKIFDYKTKRPTCLMLSYIWTMFRLGQLSFWQKTENQVLTVIDKKYMKLEKRVFEMVPMHLREKLFYRFF